MPSLFALSAILLPAAAYLIYHHVVSQAYRRKLPPGPTPLPIIGNLMDLPPAEEPEFKHWATHKDIYGPISSVTIMGMTLIIINDTKIAHELLDINANKTSGRPNAVFSTQLCGYASIILFKSYNEDFRLHRKLLHREFGTKASVLKFRKTQEVEVAKQLERVLQEPGAWLKHFRITTAATVLKMAYGYTVEPNKPDKLVSLVEKLMREFSQASLPMTWAVDIIPFLQHLPDYIPGTSFKKTARQFKNTLQTAAYVPYEFARRQMAANNHSPSYVSRLLEEYTHGRHDQAGLSLETEEAIIWTAASLYGAAADTTAITLTAFTLAMVLNPEVQSKAQEEIDRVVGTDRLPNFEDRDELPYVNALIKETLRWWPVGPLGFPHVVNEAFDYDGYLFPQDAIILPNIWWFLNNPDIYAAPDSFQPERFLSPRNEPDPGTYPFGFGRRICPGRFFADSSLYLNIAQSLACFRIAKATD
ncbi:cytochrome P450 [Stachybotrys elegans]|uniref:Cytochrome P450 n=1 Tax=Stachybotrys elegans TaxID=80388 RepID=A0A8K0WKD4_9HYPO|nr:cytochrome P450 [Stachybotrys elegans]